MGKLSDTRLRGLKPRDKRYMLSDGEGLYLEVMTSGRKVWLLRMMYNKQTHKAVLGEYPLISIAEARELRDKKKKEIISGGVSSGEVVTFQQVADVYFDRQEAKSRARGRSKYNERGRAIKYLYPAIGERDITTITPPVLRDLLLDIGIDGSNETAYRCKLILKKVFDAYNWMYPDKPALYPLSRIEKVVESAPVRHFATIFKSDEIRALMDKIVRYKGRNPVIPYALTVTLHTFIRSCELRFSEWSDVDFHAREWRIPAARMKMKDNDHIIPLSSQMVELLKELKGVTSGMGKRRYLFPSNEPRYSVETPICESAVIRAIRSMGYTKDDLTAHGLRRTASTILNSNGFSRDAIERQLSHSERDKVRDAYNAADFMVERRRMMQWWSDYLTEIQSGE